MRVDFKPLNKAKVNQKSPTSRIAALLRFVGFRGVFTSGLL